MIWDALYCRLGQNQLIINKYAVRSRYSLWPSVHHHSIHYNLVGYNPRMGLFLYQTS